MQKRMLLMDEEEMDEPEDGGDEEYDFAADNYNEEYVQVHNGRMNNFVSPQQNQKGDSYSILPFTNVQQHNPDSEYYDEDECEDDISIEENKQTNQSLNQGQSMDAHVSKGPVDENDPCVQNERLLEKYAQMLGSGMNPDGMIYGEGGDENEEIMIEDGDDNVHFASPEEYQQMLMENGVVVDVGEIEFDENEYGEYGFEN